MNTPPRLRTGLVASLGGLAATLPVATAAPVTYHEQVAPIVHRHCIACHRDADAAPFPLLSYADVRKHARDIAEVTTRGFMPPWLPAPTHEAVGGFEGERRLSTEEKAVFRNWFEAGMPEGDPAKGAPLPPAPGDWQLGPPDLVVRMPEAFVVPPDGKDVYRHFVIPVSLEGRRWVRAWQFRPRSRAVHHIFVMLDRTAEGRRQDALDAPPGFPGMDTPVGIELPPGQFSSWQPGAGARRIRPGMAWALEPGMDLVVQMHLQPLGKPEPVQSEIGFYFTKEAPTRQPVKLALVNYNIDLPAGATNLVIRDEITLPAPADLLGLLPHSHYLCRRIEAQAHFPDGAVQPLFLIPDWDFNWQGDYALQKPFHLPAGTRLAVAFTFDNSEANPRNPAHPPRRVGYGVNTTDEMAELWLQLQPSSPADDRRFQQLAFERGLRDTQSSNEQRLRLQPGDARAMVNLGRVQLARGKHGEAAQRFLKAAETDARNDDAHYYLGILHRLAGRPQEAIREFRQAVEINPGNARALGNLGLLHVAANDLGNATRYLAEAIRLNPHDAIATSTLGSIRLQQGNVPEAIELLSRAVRLDPTDAEARQLLETARQRAGAPGTVPPALAR